ncbi:MAG: divalent-cation tolerance protein CutA [Thermoplasmata archaeon]
MKRAENSMRGIVVLTTTEREEDAERIAMVLLEKKLAACVQILGPIKSRYWWEGKIESATEFLCFIKTCKKRYEEVEREIKANHPYTVPEIISIMVDEGSNDYMMWMQKIVMGK